MWALRRRDVSLGECSVSVSPAPGDSVANEAATPFSPPTFIFPRSGSLNEERLRLTGGGGGVGERLPIWDSHSISGLADPFGLAAISWSHLVRQATRG